jgi:hypothetical protein
MMTESQEQPVAPLLTEILSDAVANGADAVELERDSGGSLDVMFMAGNSGGGFSLNADKGTTRAGN